jgi:glycosyltransferase involved in cell wall biosynthesis
LRSSAEYERAYVHPQPLISVVIPTYDNYTLLRERSIPSILAQSYQNFEIVVVGDAAPEDTRQVVDGFDDPRISFHNLPYRGPYPEDPETRWLVSGVPAYNEAVRRAGGLWIAPLDDDDAFHPEHLERLLKRARDERLELVYSRLAVHFGSGRRDTLGRFPPELGEFGVQSALYHSELGSIFEYELADAAFGLASDWALCLRMMEAGVLIGMLNEVTVDYYPSRSWTPRWEGDRYGPDPASHTGPAQRESEDT